MISTNFMDFYVQFEIVPFKWLKILTKQSIFWIISDQPECLPQMMHQKELFFAVSWGKWWFLPFVFGFLFEPNFGGVKSILIHGIPDDVRKFSHPALRISSSTRCVSLPRVFLRIHTLSHLQSWSTSGPMVPTHGSMMHHDAMAIDPDFLTLKISAMVFPMPSSLLVHLHPTSIVAGQDLAWHWKIRWTETNHQITTGLFDHSWNSIWNIKWNMSIIWTFWIFNGLSEISIDGTTMAHQDAPSQGIPRAQGLITHCHAHSGAQIIEWKYGTVPRKSHGWSFMSHSFCHKLHKLGIIRVSTFSGQSEKNVPCGCVYSLINSHRLWKITVLNTTNQFSMGHLYQFATDITRGLNSMIPCLLAKSHLSAIKFPLPSGNQT